MALVVISGTPGSGKTTLAHGLERLGWDVVDASVLRRGGALPDRCVMETNDVPAFVSRIPHVWVILRASAEVAARNAMKCCAYPSLVEAKAVLRERGAAEGPHLERVFGLACRCPTCHVFNVAGCPPAQLVGEVGRIARSLAGESVGGVIGPFRGEHFWLSNMYPVEIEADGIVYGSSEAYYQAQKTRDMATRGLMASMDGKEAKRFAATLDLPDGWETERFAVMRRALELKFASGGELSERLLSTRGHYLIERNDWHDNVFGACTCEECADTFALNMLGTLLMHRRAELALEQMLGSSTPS